MKKLLGILMVVYSLFAIGLVSLAFAAWVGGIKYPLWVEVTWLVIGLLVCMTTVGNSVFHLVRIDPRIIEGEINQIVFPVLFLYTIFAFILAFNQAPDVLSAADFCVFCILLYPNIYVFFIEKPSAKIVTKPAIEVVNGEPRCSVCKVASQYEVCLECERKHQKEIQRVRSQNWRAKKAGEPATLTLAQWLQTLENFGNKCAYCQTGPYECMEHFIPVGQGVKSGGTTANNCVPSCFKCNVGKSNKHPEK